MENEAIAPAQRVVFPSTETEGVTGAVTIVVIPFDVVGLLVTFGIFEVITQVTDAPEVSEDVVNVALFVPAAKPFTYH